MRLPWLALFLVCLLVCASGCATSNHRLTLLAERSSESAGDWKVLAQGYQQLAVRVRTYLEGDTILASLDDSHSPLSEAELKNLEGIHKQLIARARLFDRLSQVHTALGQLASYDGSREVERAVNHLDLAINEVAKSTGKPPVISPSGGEASPGVFVGLVRGRQAIVARYSQRLLDPRVELIRQLVGSEAEQESVLGLIGVFIRGHARVAKRLYEMKAVTAQPTFAKIAESSGLGINSKSDFTIDNAPIGQAMLKLIDQKAAREVEDARTLHQETIERLSR